MPPGSINLCRFCSYVLERPLNDKLCNFYHIFLVNQGLTLNLCFIPFGNYKSAGKSVIYERQLPNVIGSWHHLSAVT